jgi:hypothetical protein
MTRQFHGTEIDVVRHMFAPRPIEESIACRVRKANDAQLDRGAFAAIWNPFVEHEAPPDAALNWACLLEAPSPKNVFGPHQRMAF